MNYLAGDDNPNKRPWQFIMKNFDRADDMTEEEWYLDKIKFWKIIWHGAAVALGTWRERYLAARNDPSNVGKSREECIKIAEDRLDAQAAEMLEKGKEAYFDGVRSSPKYHKSLSSPVRFTIWTKEKGIQNAEIKLQQAVEGRGNNNVGLAPRYGFMNASKIGNPPEYIEIVYPAA